MLQLLTSVTCGVVVGFGFGLTGVGSVFAVPLLVYALGIAPHRAVCISMFAISLFALVATAVRVQAKEIDYRRGVLVGAGGIIGAPLGAWVGRTLSGEQLLLVFSLFVMLIGLNMLVPRSAPVSRAESKRPGRFQDVALFMAGLITGFLAGLLGVSGGFLIVPALAFFGRVEIHRAIATSLPVIFVIGVTAVIAHLLARQTIPMDVTASFAGFGLVGLAAGMSLGKRLPEKMLQRVFGITLVIISALLLNLGLPHA